MAYASSAQVQAEFKDITFSSTTPVSTSDVTQWLADADAEINSRLSAKYQTPITGTEALIVMAMLEVWLVKHRILDVLKVKTGKASEDQDSGKTYRQMALDFINDLVKGTVNLTDATYASAADGVRSYSNDNSIANVFDRSTKQW